MSDLKSILPEELRIAMRLDRDQFEELEVECFEVCIQYGNTMASLDIIPDEPTECEVAFRPSHNPRGQYFAVKYLIMLDKNGQAPNGYGMRFEVTGFKPMNQAEYVKYCYEEYGEIPPLKDDYGMN